MRRFVLVFGMMLAAASPAGAAPARVDCSVASTAAMARLLGFRCGSGESLRSAALPARPLVPPPEILRIVERLALQNGIEAKLVVAVIAAESAFDARAVSPRNAQGLMQLMPDTSARFGVRNPFDAEDNIRGGTTYLHWLLQQFGGNVDLALAAYNAGEGAVWSYGTVPPYDETIEYIGRVKRFYGLYQRGYR